MGWTEKHGSKYRGCYRDQSAKIHKTPAIYSSARKARQAAADQEAQLRSGTWFDPDAGRITFGDYYTRQWLPARMALLEGNTQQNHRSHWRAKRHGLQVTWGHVQLRAIRNSDVQAWVGRMVEDGLSAATIEARVVSLQTVLAAQRGASAMRDGLIPSNPCHGVMKPVRPRKRVEVFTPDEVNALLGELGHWWSPVAEIAVNLGMRWGEVTGLRVCDVNLNRAEVHVMQVIETLPIARTGNGTPFRVKHYPKEGPGNGPKRVGLDPETYELIGALIEERRLGAEDLLLAAPDRLGGALRQVTRGPQPRGRGIPALPPEQWLPLRTDVWPGGVPISGTYYRAAVWNPAVARAGVPRLTFHKLRATHISWLLSGSAPPSEVQQRVGHSQLSTTQRYIGVLPDADTRLLAALAQVKGRARQPRQPRRPQGAA